MGIVISLAGLIIAIRTEKNLYFLIIIATILLSFLIISFLVVFLRYPGQFGKKGAYRYEKIRWVAFIVIGFISGLIFAFLLLKPNRDFVRDAIYGIPTDSFISQLTPTPKSTVTSFPSNEPISTATFVTNPTIEFTSTPTSAPTQTFTPTPEILFKDDFLDNKNKWSLSAGSIYTQRIVGGKLVYEINCTFRSICSRTLQIPFQDLTKFDLEFEVKNINVDSTALFIVRFRYRDGNYYFYHITFGGNVLGGAAMNGDEGIIIRASTQNLSADVNSVNKIRVLARDAEYILYVNDFEVARFEDGNLKSPGGLIFGFSTDESEMLAVEVDNLVIRKVP